MDIYSAVIGRTVLMGVFFASLRVIGLTYSQALFMILIMASLMMVGLFPVITRGVIGAAFVWSIAIAMGIAPSYTGLEKSNFKSLEEIAKIDFANAVRKELTDGSDRSKKEGAPPNGDYERQLHAVDLLVESGAMMKEDAERMKQQIGRKRAPVGTDITAATPK